MTTQALLELDQLHISYGGIRAVQDLELKVYPGEIVCLIGANGAGKTSTLRAISGLLTPSKGTIKLEGRSLQDIDTAQRVSLGLSLCPEGRMVLAQQSVEANLLLGAWTRSQRSSMARSLEDMYQLFPRLRERRLQSAGTLSGGEQQMLAIARSLMAQPKLLMLDEPSLGLAPLIVEEIFAKLSSLNKHGMSILLVEQNAHLALNLAHRAYVLESGCLQLSGKAQDLAHDPRVQAAYLGLSAGG